MQHLVIRIIAALAAKVEVFPLGGVDEGLYPLLLGLFRRPKEV